MEASLVPGRVNPRQIGWIKRVVLPPDNDENQYLDVLEIPNELVEHAQQFLPIDFRNQRFQMDMMGALQEMQEGERDMGVLPFIVYIDPLTMMLRAKERLGVKNGRTAPLTDPAKIEAIAERGTITVFDLHRLYQSALRWFGLLDADELTRARIGVAIDMHKNALQIRANLILKAVLQIPGIQEVLLHMKDPNSTLTSCYSEEIALKFGEILRAYLCSAVRLMQHIIVRICLINTDHIEPNRLLLSDDTPPSINIPDFVVAAQLDHQRNFVKYCNSVNEQEKRTPYFDEEHINRHPSSHRGQLSPSLLFQTMLHIVIGDLSHPLPTPTDMPTPTVAAMLRA